MIMIIIIVYYLYDYVMLSSFVKLADDIWRQIDAKCIVHVKKSNVRKRNVKCFYFTHFLSIRETYF